MQENARRETHHSSRDLPVPAFSQEHTGETTSATPESPPQEGAKERIKWSKMSDAKEWVRLDEDLNKVFKAVQAGAIEVKVDSVTTIAYNMAKEREKSNLGNIEPPTTSLRHEG